MSRDDTRMGKPSAWSSDEPAVSPAIVHTHPLTPAVRVILVLYGLMLAASLGGLMWVVLAGQHQDAKDRAAVVKRVEKDIAAAQEAGKARDAANNEKTRRIVCIVIKESFPTTPNTRALAHQLGCDILTPSPTPTPATTTGAEPRPGRTTIYVIEPAPSSEPAASPRATKKASSPSPRPSPSPTHCTLPKPLPCVAANE